MANQPKSRSGIIWALSAVVFIALVVLVVGVPGWREGTGAKEASSTLTQPAASAGGAREVATSTPAQEAPLPSQEAPKPQEMAPMPHCWGDLPRLDQMLSLDTFRAVLASVIATEDRFLLTYLHERLTGLVGNDPQKALKVLSWAEEVSEGLELVVFMEALKKAPAIQNPKVSERLLQMAENPRGSLALRAASVIGLETQKRLDPAALQRLKQIALDATVDQVAWNATRTIGRVMEEDFKSTGNYRPYWDELLDISRKSEDRGVRGLALEMPTYANLILDETSVEKLSEIMRTDRDHEIREMAAMRLSVTEAPERALEAYRAAFATETEFCIRWAFFRYALRAAGPAALPLVEQFAQQEPRFQQDYLDFKEIYGRGVVDWERVWLDKKLYHDQCLDAHEPEPQP